MSQPGGADRGAMFKLTLAALGVVYGDIGTSPLYALKESFHGHHLDVTPENVLGVLSLIVWTLIVIVSTKYLGFVLRADNHGEGGILALMALVQPKEHPRAWSFGWWLVVLGLFGAALLYGDGVLTPAISVLSAVEGLGLAVPAVEQWVVPITVGILIALFSVQRRGTAAVGAYFGPVMVLWFVVLAALGALNVAYNPQVLGALLPTHAVAFLMGHQIAGFYVLGSVFLVCTGGEALYADMGHFGREPIRWAWFGMVLPALLLNYFGQGALLLSDPEVAHPFFGLAPSWGLVPLVLLATAATVIASQALISGVYSLTHQAISLGFCPRMTISHTSADEAGQIYVAPINWALLVGTIAVVVGFGSSSALAAAYGIAVATTMVITSVLAAVVAVRQWGWSLPVTVGLWGAFLVVELAFFAANVLKIADGGWFPLVVGAVLFTLMTTWSSGRAILGEHLRNKSMPIDVLFKVMQETPPHRTPRTAIFMTSEPERVPPTLVRNLVHNQVLHQRVILLTVRTDNVPYVDPETRVEVHEVGQGFWRVFLRFGFMETPDVPVALARCRDQGLVLNLDDVTWFLGRETILPTEGVGMALWREHVFAWMALNAQRATSHFRIPPAYVIEMGTQIEI